MFVEYYVEGWSDKFKVIVCFKKGIDFLVIVCLLEIVVY